MNVASGFGASPRQVFATRYDVGACVAVQLTCSHRQDDFFILNDCDDTTDWNRGAAS
jgi:hypothetical protein